MFVMKLLNEFFVLELTKNLGKENETTVEDPLELEKGTEGKEAEEVPRT